MSRRWPVYISLTAALVGAVVIPTAASAAGQDTPPTAACTADTQQVKDLNTAVTAIGSALQATPPDATKLAAATGDLVGAVTAAQAANCLPALPSATKAVPLPAPTPPSGTTAAGAQKCLADTVQVLSASLGAVAAGISATPDATAALKSATDLATAITALNTDKCLPISLPVPSVPAVPAPVPPVPPVPPVAPAP